MRASLRNRGSFVLPALIALFLAFCGAPASSPAATGPKAHAASAKAHKKAAKRNKKASKKKAAKKRSKHVKRHKSAKKHKKARKARKAKKAKKRKKAVVAGASAGTLSATAAGAGTRDEQARASTNVRVAPSFFGVVANEALGQTGAQRDATLGQIRAAGAGMLRQKMDWATIERSPNVYDFTEWDQYMLATAAAGLQVLPVLFNPPAFD